MRSKLLNARYRLPANGMLTGWRTRREQIFGMAGGKRFRMKPPRTQTKRRRCHCSTVTFGWLGREGSNLRMAESKSAALPLGYAPTHRGLPLAASHQRVQHSRVPVIDQCARACRQDLRPRYSSQHLSADASLAIARAPRQKDLVRFFSTKPSQRHNDELRDGARDRAGPYTHR